MSNDARTCPVCESPLTTDAIREGRCQCCGSQLPKGGDSKADEKKQDS